MIFQGAGIDDELGVNAARPAASLWGGRSTRRPSASARADGLGKAYVVTNIHPTLPNGNQRLSKGRSPGEKESIDAQKREMDFAVAADQTVRPCQHDGVVKFAAGDSINRQAA
jgi:hypothetical protein